jgi:hypothetical protein
VCRSIATAEILSLGDGFDTAAWLEQIWLKLTSQVISIRLLVDSMGIANLIATTKLPAERRLRIDYAVVREGLRNGVFSLIWVPSRANLADPFVVSRISSRSKLAPRGETVRTAI